MKNTLSRNLMRWGGALVLGGCLAFPVTGYSSPHGPVMGAVSARHTADTIHAVVRVALAQKAKAQPGGDRQADPSR
jgi:hypothetical protein